MKKFVSRVYTTLITALAVFLAYGIISFAAEGTVQITDTTGKVGKELRHSKLHRLIPHILGLKKYQYAVLFLESGRKVRWILETHFGIDIH